MVKDTNHLLQFFHQMSEESGPIKMLCYMVNVNNPCCYIAMHYSRVVLIDNYNSIETDLEPLEATQYLAMVESCLHGNNTNCAYCIRISLNIPGYIV